jgi:hypothetical protein
MALVQATAAFDWAGIKVEVGDVFEDDHILYVKFPSKFAVPNVAVGNSAAGTTPGNCVKKIEVFNSAGTSLGFLAVYDAIT